MILTNDDGLCPILSCSLAGLILISTVVCFLLPPFRYHLTLTHTHISIFITYFGYIPSCSLAGAHSHIHRCLFSPSSIPIHHADIIVLVVLFVLPLLCLGCLPSHPHLLFSSTLSPFSSHLYFRVVPSYFSAWVILPAVESADCADPGVVACFQIPPSNRLYPIKTRVVPHSVAHTTAAPALLLLINSLVVA